MADEIIRLDYSAEDIGDNIDEVRTARGTFDTLDDRLDNIESGGPSPSDPIASNCVSPMTGYSKSSSSTPGNISTSDTLNAAIGKLEKRTELNENNISTITPALKVSVWNGKKQLLQFYSDTNGALVATAQSNGYSVIITGGDDNIGKTVSYADCTIEKTGNYTFSCDLSGTGASCYIYDVTTGTQIRECYATSSETLTLTGGHTYQLRTYRKGSGTNATVAAMICESALYAISSDMRPYAMSNAEITAWILAHS